MGRNDANLSDDEARLLALLLRAGPSTLTELCQIYAASPVGGFDAGRRRLRTLVAGLERRGLVARDGESVGGTQDGQAAVREWAMTIGPEDLLPEDPLRSKVQSFDLLSRDEQRAWAIEAKAALEAHLERLDAYGREVTVPFHALVHDNAVRSMRARIAWLDRLLGFLARQERGGRSPH